MSEHTLSMPIELNDEDTEIQVSFTYSPHEPQTRTDPENIAEIEVDEITHGNLVLNNWDAQLDMDVVESKCWEYMEENLGYDTLGRWA